ncbi:MAG: hypothetical protein Tsb009_12410 [Planctomycetaceae bacterium]
MKTGSLMIAIVAAVTGCAAPGDPSCDVHRALSEQSRAESLFYHPELDLVGIEDASWYSCAPCWTPACSVVECQRCSSEAVTTYPVHTSEHAPNSLIPIPPAPDEQSPNEKGAY